jgi:predicted flap endonuclease-1-like 5' DNA nuclease
MFEQSPTVGPGVSTLTSHTLEILLLLAAAFVLGYLLRYWLSGAVRAKLEADLAAERRHRRQLEADFDRVRGEHSAMGGRISTLEGDLTGVRGDLAQRVLERDGAKSGLDAASEQFATLKSQFDGAERSRADLATQNTHLSKELSACGDKQGELNAELVRLRALLEDCANKRSALDTELTALRARAGDGAQVQRAEFDAALAASRTELSAALANRDALRAELDARSERQVQAVLPLAVPSASVKTKPDDLKIVEGIGPKINDLLHAAGIHTFVELANAPVARLREILQAAGERYRIHDPASWPEQAQLCAEGAWDQLKVLQDRLTAGRA